MLIDINKSKLVKKIYDESKPQNPNATHNFYAKLEGFANYVVPQLTQTNLLFEEYTPHDQFHMESLFRIADELLGDKIIGNLSSCEACVLACSIYGHDWGMALSHDEKEIIVTGKTPNARSSGDFALLPNESNKWKSFAKNHQIELNVNGFIEIKETDLEKRKEKIEILIPKKIWREYVRQTHSERSKARAIAFLKEDDSKFAGLVGEVCAGHWYDISKIRKLKRNELAFSQSNNLQALATYMRFIDLLDIGSDRTPYSLWKFVNPLNLFSSNEWKKHISLEPVYFKRDTSSEIVNSQKKWYQFRSKKNTLDTNLRKTDLTIIVQGNTDDHKVYASLKDMENWMSDQINENEQLLKELEGYSLGQILLEWDIEPNGFEPIDIRFEFDRPKMFELISGEIYEGDPYVFLRELLQNGIDAIKIRELSYKEKGLSLDFDKLFIDINVQHLDNGNAEITIIDSGSGMNLHIIKNYLSIIGKSYYRSDEFNNLKLDISPISRFGVGLISCFEIADSISIQTKSDSLVNSKSEEFEIEIENYNHQFKIKKLPADSIEIGTKIKVSLISSKWKKNDFENKEFLEVTNYIKKIAGFVPYPIHINENSNKTIILSPTISAQNKTLIKEKNQNVAFWELPLELKLKDVIEPLDIANSNLIYEEHTKLISTKIDGVGFSGAISYFIVKPEVIGSTRNVTGSQTGATVKIKIADQLLNIPMRWEPNNPNIKAPSLSNSSKTNKFRKLFLQGILVPDALDKVNLGGTNLPPNKIVLNINNSKEIPIEISLSRKKLKGDNSLIESVIKSAYKEEMELLFKEKLEKPNLLDRLILISQMSLYNTNNETIQELLPIGSWPIPILKESGLINLIELGSLKSDIEIISKQALSTWALPYRSWDFQEQFNTPLPNLFQTVTSGDKPIILKELGFEYDDGSPMEWNYMEHSISYCLMKLYSRHSLRVVNWNGENFIIEHWKKSTNPIDVKVIGKFDFILFHTSMNDTFGILPLRNDQMSKNYLSDVLINLNHPSGKILELAIEKYNQGIETVNPQLASMLKISYMELGLKGYGYSNYTGNHFEHLIPVSTRAFCNALAGAGLLELSHIDKAELAKPMNIYTAKK